MIPLPIALSGDQHRLWLQILAPAHVVSARHCQIRANATELSRVGFRSRSTFKSVPNKETCSEKSMRILMIPACN
ncbi:hypothetical protein BDZ89DRAFT_216768 [Hymenopellis radicata]|nr:hypothetical protein BDZ89DRAFT_216768 [Hymenopellis radicata]